MTTTAPNPNPLLMRNLPLFMCCGHCKPIYCPDGAGHYAPCPNKGCIQGQVEKPR